ncbi:MAG: 3-phosphoshikimate 1-carboxyvinyltransferase [Terriglobia bacterium]
MKSETPSAERLMEPVQTPVTGSVRLPGSKSITNRALPLAALSEGHTLLTGALFAEDTLHMIACLRALGIAVVEDAANKTIHIAGCAGVIPATEADLFVGNSGTTARFLLSAICLGHGTYRMDGVPRMRQRPMRELVEALRALGADIAGDAMPLTVQARGLAGGQVRIAGAESSQFLSGLLMACPLASGNETAIGIDGPLFSDTYVSLTLSAIRAFGGVVHATKSLDRFTIPASQSYRSPGTFAIEPDASAASYFFAAAALTRGCVRVLGLTRQSTQGDIGFVDLLEQMGCNVESGADYVEVTGPAQLRGITCDMNTISDTVMTLAVLAPFADGPTHIHNVEHIRFKETDRLAAITEDLRRVGVQVDERQDGLTIYPCHAPQPAAIETFDDHRMAMSFAIMGLRARGIRIQNPACVAKTFPEYFEVLDALVNRSPIG